MSPGKPSRTAYKVALNILTLGAKPDMADILPAGIVEATERLLVGSGAVSRSAIGLVCLLRLVSTWLLTG